MSRLLPVLVLGTVVLAVWMKTVTGSTTGFPNPYGGCPMTRYPKPLPLDPNNLPPSIVSALDQAGIAAATVARGLGTMGLSMGVIYNQELIWTQGFGRANSSDPTSIPTPDTIFRIGSISKVFATLKMLQYKESGVLASIDDEITTYEPRFSLKQTAVSSSKRGITFRQLATHLSGAPRESPCGNSPPNCAMSSAQAYDRIATMTQILDTDRLPIYSNLGFDILGNVLADRLGGGQLYTDLIAEMIAPLGLTHTGVNMSQAPAQYVALPYNSDGSSCPAEECLSDFGWSDPSGSMYSSVRDLASLVSMFFRDTAPADPSNGQLIDGATIREMLNVRFLNSDRETAFALPFECYALGDYFLRTKRGDVDGYASEMILVPELKVGVVVLANVVENAADAAQHMIGVLLPAFDALFRTLNPSGNIEPVPNPQQFVGTYTATFTAGATLRRGKRITQRFQTATTYQFTVTLQGTNTLVLGGAGNPLGGESLLQWLGDENPNAGALTFRMMPASGDLTSCLSIQVGDDFQFITFATAPNGQIVSFTADILFGVVFQRTSSSTERDEL